MQQQDKFVPQNQEQRYYFINSLIGYNLGMFATYLAMSATLKPQPALLYICPTMLAVYLGGAFLRREALKMLSYDEDEAL